MVAVGVRLRVKHMDPDCAGEWERWVGEQREWLACTACGAVYVPFPALVLAAERENELGRVLKFETYLGRRAQHGE